MDFRKERKVIHDEWNVAHIDAKDFFDNLGLFKDDDGYFEGCPTLKFDNGEVYVDESWGIGKDGHIYTSSERGGVMSYRNGEYILSVYCHERNLGQFVGLEISIDEGFEKRLLAA